MKNKITSIIMFFIILAIIGASALVGLIIIQEVTGLQISDMTKIFNSDEIEETVSDFETDIAVYNDTIEKNIEVPQIRTTENPLEVTYKENEPEQEVVNYDDIEVNKYFYNQLEEPSQVIYRAFEQNKDNMITGTYAVQLGNAFSYILDKDDGQEELSYYYQSAIEAYLYDNPDVFYLSPNKMYLNIETTTRRNSKTYNIYIDSGDEINYLSDEFSSASEVENAISQIEDVRRNIIRQRTSNNYENIKLIHDYLIDTIEYDSESQDSNIYNIYGALVNKRCVCEGYAKSLKYLLDALGIESTLVIGKATNSSGESENHAWNYVKLDGNWYAIDSTWDDPIVIGGGYVSNESKYRYFLKGSHTMNENHFPLGTFTENGKEFTYPELSTEDY